MGKFRTLARTWFTDARPNHAAANGGGPSRLQSAHLVAAVAEPGSLDATRYQSHLRWCGSAALTPDWLYCTRPDSAFSRHTAEDRN